MAEFLKYQNSKFSASFCKSHAFYIREWILQKLAEKWHFQPVSVKFMPSIWGSEFYRNWLKIFEISVTFCKKRSHTTYALQQLLLGKLPRLMDLDFLTSNSKVCKNPRTFWDICFYFYWECYWTRTRKDCFEESARLSLLVCLQYSVFTFPHFCRFEIWAENKKLKKIELS